MNEVKEEVWRDVEGFPCYQVSNLGRVKSTKGKTTKILKNGQNQAGYYTVSLTTGLRYGEGKKYTKQVHRLVALAFIPNPENKPQIDHKDTNVKNNYIHINPDGTVDEERSNLHWVTAKENLANPISAKRILLKNQRLAKEREKPIFVYDEDLSIVSAFTSTAEAGRLGFNQGNVTCCCNGVLKRYRGHIWSYIVLRDTRQREIIENAADEKRKRRIASINKASAKYQKVYYQTHKEDYLRRAKEQYQRNKQKKKNDKTISKIKN